MSKFELIQCIFILMHQYEVMSEQLKTLRGNEFFLVLDQRGDLHTTMCGFKDKLVTEFMSYPKEIFDHYNKWEFGKIKMS